MCVKATRTRILYARSWHDCVLSFWVLTSPLEIFIPHRPHLYDEKRRPAKDVRQNYHKSHFNSPQLGSWYSCDAADGILSYESVFGSGAGRPFPFLEFDVFPYGVTNEPVAHHENNHRHQEDAHGDPGDIRLGPPRLDEVRPAIVNLRATLDLAQGEDEILRGAERQAAHPGGDDHDIGALAGLLESFQRVTDGDVTVEGHHYHHVGGREHSHHLEVFNYSAEKVGTVETERDLPAQLREHLEEGDHQVSQAEVLDEKVHPWYLLLGVVHGQQDAHVPNHSDHEGDAQDHYLDLGNLLVSRKRIRSVGLEEFGAVSRRPHVQISGTGNQRAVHSV